MNAGSMNIAWRLIDNTPMQDLIERDCFCFVQWPFGALLMVTALYEILFFCIF
jgi:hypothetical protein